MSQATLLGPPPVIDVQVELLHRSDDSWMSANDAEIPIGDQVALRCRNRGDREVSAAVFMRAMSGELRSVSSRTYDLWPGLPTEFGTQAGQPIMFREQDVEIVLGLSDRESLIQELLDYPLSEQNLPRDEVARLGTTLRGKPSERPITNEDLGPLLQLAYRGEFQQAAYALQALTLLQPPRHTRMCVSQLLRKRLRMPQLIHRPWLTAVAANLGDGSLRGHLRGMAADSTDPQRDVALRALADVGDACGLESISSSLGRTGAEQSHAAMIIATMYQDLDITSINVPVAEDGPASFWLAMAEACRGSFTAIEQRVTGADDIAFRRLIGDVANSFYAIRDLRPLTDEMRHYIEDTLTNRDLAPNVNSFYKQLLEEMKDLALTEGMRSVPDGCAEKIRSGLGRIPEITQLTSFAPEADGWERASRLSPAQRGVLLSELLSKAVTELSPHMAATVIHDLVHGWPSHSWYPHLASLLSVLRKLESKDFDFAAPGVELQIGWLLSRAPISQLLRLVNERIRQDDVNDSDIRALVNAIVTHWDSAPPPLTARVTRVPRMIQQITLTEDLPWRRTRAWLEEKTRVGNVWSATIMLNIGTTEAELSPTEESSASTDGEHSAEDFGELIVVPRAHGAVVTPKTAQLRLSSEQQAASTTFEITTEQEVLELLIAIYQQQPTMLLQELRGIIELSERTGEG